MQADYSSYDASLTALRPLGPDLKNGLSNHVPMVAEALCAMGASAASGDWVASQLVTIRNRPKAPFKLDPKNWHACLGDPVLFSDWQRYFETEIEALGWDGALTRWCDRLAPGLFASATHGIIRAGHAARALALEETAVRRSELADGLAVWAATYQTLPDAPTGSPLYETVDDAFPRLPRVPLELRKTDGLITEALAPLETMPEFGEVIGWLDFSKNAGTIADDLAKQQAHVFLDNVKTPLLAIVFTHAITSVHAILNLVPHVSENTAARMLAYGWQAGAALYSAYAQEDTGSASVPDAENPQDIITLAIDNGDDHVIKLSEACLAFFERTKDPIFLSVPFRARQYLPMA